MPSSHAHSNSHSSIRLLRGTHLPISTFVLSHPTPRQKLWSILGLEEIPDDNPLSPGRLPLERQLKRVADGVIGEEPLSVEESEEPVIAGFVCDAGKKTASPRVRNTRVLEGP